MARISVYFVIALLSMTSVTLAQDSIQMFNVIDVDVIKPNVEHKENAIPYQIAELEAEKNNVCYQLKAFHSDLRTFSREDLFLSTTGSYKPEVVMGLKKMQILTDNISDKINLQISYILVVKLDYTITSKYIKQLNQMRDEVNSEYNYATTTYSNRLTSY